MANKPRICIEVFHRGKITVQADAEDKYGLSIFHWAVLIRPKAMKDINECITFDVTNGIDLDPTTGEDQNPHHDWRFRRRGPEDPFRTGQALGAIVIGKVPKRMKIVDIETTLRTVPLPQRGDPAQNCHTWTEAAIEALRAAGLITAGNTRQIMRAAKDFGKEVISKRPLPKVEDRFRTVSGMFT